ncbi:unnamed protein product [Rangifer tarandus platyrhynchus]|uniref:Uncharacterized protein n=1 Tax=Rangifer tarandus platyrhynchus TaxID=3082113 RepID=A0AC59ZS69_RANTA
MLSPARPSSTAALSQRPAPRVRCLESLPLCPGFDLCAVSVHWGVQVLCALQQSRKVVTVCLQSPVLCPGAAPSPAEFSSLGVSDDNPFIRTETLDSGMSLS